MVKRLFVLLISISLVFLLVACDSSKYSQATTAYNSQDYETAISLFEELGDYKDSKEQLKKSLDVFIVDLRYAREWEKASVYLEKYKTLVSESEYEKIFCETLEGFVSGFCYDENWEKAKSIVDAHSNEFNVSNLYDQITYEHGISLLKKDRFEEGLNELSSIKSESTFYDKAQETITDYNKLKSLPFVQKLLGSWYTKTTVLGEVIDGNLYFELKYNRLVCRSSSGAFSSEYNFFYDDFSGNFASNGNFSCSLKDDGRLYFSGKYGGEYYTKR